MWWNAELKEMTGQQLCELVKSNDDAYKLFYQEIMGYYDFGACEHEVIKDVVLNGKGFTNLALIKKLEAERLLWIKAGRMEDDQNDH